MACRSRLRAPSAAPTASQAAALGYQQLSGQRVSSTYHRLPWQKDRRLGELEGRLEGAGVARIVDRFSQGDQLSGARLTILFDDRQATIHWDRTDSPGEPMPSR